jgi:hypothetical protein
MRILPLTPAGECALEIGALAVMNPPMTYDKTLGTPTAQAIVPPFQNLPAHIDEITGTGAAYTWNYKLGIWN